MRMTPTTTSTTGLEALYLAAVDSNVSFVTAVAGYPITVVMNRFLENNKDGVVGADMDANTTIGAKWMTNEKVALEGALGASVSGRRALVLTKHVGMNVLSDPLVTSATHSIGAGLVIFAGDDPGVAASQNEQDSRWYGEIAEVAVYDPSTPQNAYSAVVRAFELSEQVSAPVIVRITHRLEISEGLLERTKKDQQNTKVVFDRSIWAITMRGKHEKLHLESYPKLVKESEHSPLNRLTMGLEGEVEDGNIGIISSGYPSALVANVLDTRTNVSHLELGMVNPIPFNTVREFVKAHKRVLIVEETEPFIESHLCILDNVLGKKTGHLPYGQVDVEHIEYALDHINNDTVVKYIDIQTIVSRGSRKARSICDDCPYMPLYHILHDLDVMIAGDLGCSVRSAPAPLEAVDTGFALGSSIAVACGFEKKGIAVIGDFGLAHSGIIGLINAVHCEFDVVVIVLQNKVAAMTGGQDVPDLIDVVKAEVADVSSFDIDAGVIGTLLELINEKLDKRGVSVIFVKGKCRKY
ncbi:MAG: thiamine pyrophosphate-dependent enzyme [Methanosarcinaceae archaeon]|nr:thiamine pyrophosphate-dependent enzyme [Methanosarcinaceae archaeon]MDF1533959.1 thiamine pyrophosphate-dependent enzyme [Methanosarcinaceae archaeon]